MSGNLVVVSGDPGVNVGYCVIRLPALLLRRQGLVHCISRMKTSCGQFRSNNTSENVDNWLKVARAAYEEIADDEDYFALVMEGFTLQMLSSDPTLLEPVKFNAVLDDRLRGKQRVEYQLPVEGKTITDQRLGLWGLLEASAGRVPHGRDAMRHALFYAKRWCQDARVRARTGWVEDKVSR